MIYTIVFHRTDEGISVSVPGLPGCWSEGETAEKFSIGRMVAEYENLLDKFRLRKLYN